jgi:hypothetical protein
MDCAPGHRGFSVGQGTSLAIRGFTNSLRTELIHESSGIHLTMVHLPAVNTPQFDWARTHMKNQPRPVAPEFQPETIADAIHKAAHENKREYWLGRSSVGIILANFLVPELLEGYLAQAAFRGQSARRKVAADRRDNLLQPVPDLHRTRGSFGGEAESRVVAMPGPATRMAVTTVALVCAGLPGATIGRRIGR